jgi:hypothetical protein
MLLVLPLLLPACSGGECIDIGIPSGVSIGTAAYTLAPPGSTVEVCAGSACGTAPVDEEQAFIDLPVSPDEDVELTVSVRDTTDREVARSDVTVRPMRQDDGDACDSGQAGQVMLELDAAGKAVQAQ